MGDGARGSGFTGRTDENRARGETAVSSTSSVQGSHTTAEKPVGNLEWLGWSQMNGGGPGRSTDLAKLRISKLTVGGVGTTDVRTARINCG